MLTRLSATALSLLSSLTVSRSGRAHSSQSSAIRALSRPRHVAYVPAAPLVRRWLMAPSMVARPHRLYRFVAHAPTRGSTGIWSSFVLLTSRAFRRFRARALMLRQSFARVAARVPRIQEIVMFRLRITSSTCGSTTFCFVLIAGRSGWRGRGCSFSTESTRLPHRRRTRHDR